MKDSNNGTFSTRIWNRTEVKYLDRVPWITEIFKELKLRGQTGVSEFGMKIGIIGVQRDVFSRLRKADQF